MRSYSNILLTTCHFYKYFSSGAKRKDKEKYARIIGHEKNKNKEIEENHNTENCTRSRYLITYPFLNFSILELEVHGDYFLETLTVYTSTH